MWMQRAPTQPLLRPAPDMDEPLGEQLKCYFDSLTEGPTPERLVRLTEMLEAAFDRGDLRCEGTPPRR